jgi:hypothetical protein
MPNNAKGARYLRLKNDYGMKLAGSIIATKAIANARHGFKIPATSL